MSCKCENVVRLLVEFLERQLPPDVHADLERHLARCPDCLTQLKTYKCTLSILKDVKEEELPTELRWTLKAFMHKGCSN